MLRATLSQRNARARSEGIASFTVPAEIQHTDIESNVIGNPSSLSAPSPPSLYVIPGETLSFAYIHMKGNSLASGEASAVY